MAEPTDYYTSRYSGEEIDNLLDEVKNGGGGGGGVRPNLLDNWDFRTPVNQRGVSGQISSHGYFIDRWKLVSGTAEITSAGLVLNGTISQILPEKIGPVHSSVALTANKLLTCSYDDESKTFTISGTGDTIIAAKLEMGDNQTLAEQTQGGVGGMLQQLDADYGTRLIACQRYLYSPYYGAFPTAPIGTVFPSNDGTGFVNVALPVLMRAKPVFSGDPSTLWLVKSNGGGAQKPSALSVMGMSGCGVFMSVSASFGSDGGQYILYSEGVSNPSDFLLSAEL